MSEVRRTADEAMVGGLIEDAETDRRLVAEWDATLPPLPDGDYDDPHVVEERKRDALLAFLADPIATAVEKRNVLDRFLRLRDAAMGVPSTIGEAIVAAARREQEPSR